LAQRFEKTAVMRFVHTPECSGDDADTSTAFE
jgi:hypothetical protein